VLLPVLLVLVLLGSERTKTRASQHTENLPLSPLSLPHSIQSIYRIVSCRTACLPGLLASFIATTTATEYALYMGRSLGASVRLAVVALLVVVLGCDLGTCEACSPARARQRARISDKSAGGVCDCHQPRTR